MADPVDQPRDRTRRGPLFILTLAAVIVAGLWYWQTHTETQGPPEQLDITQATNGTAPMTGDAETAGTGTARTDHSGTASSADGLQSSDAATAISTNIAPVTESGTTMQTDGGETTGSGTAGHTDHSGPAGQTDGARTTVSDAATQEDALRTAGSDTAGHAATPRTIDSDAPGRTDGGRTTDSDIAVAPETARTAGTDPTAVPGTGQTADAGRSGPESRTASAEPADAGAGTAEAPRVAPVPDEGTITRAPIEAPPATDAIGEASILAAADQAIEQLETVIREKLRAALDAASDTKLRVQVTYDDSQEDTASVLAEPDEPNLTTDSGTEQRADTGQSGGVRTTASDAAGQTTDSDAAGQATDSDAAAQEDTLRTAGSDTAGHTATPRTIDSDTPGRTDGGRTTDSDIAVAPETARTAGTDPTAVPGTGQTADTGRSESESRTASAEPADAGAGTAEAPLVTPVPDEGTITRAPIEAPPATDAIGEAGILAAADQAIEQLETVIREKLRAALDAASDTKLRVQVTYDDSQEDTAPALAEPDEPSLTTDSGTEQRADTGQTTDSGATLPAGEIQAAGSDVVAIEDPIQSSASGDAAPSEDTRIAGASEDEARNYVENLTDAAPSTIPVDKADHFVTQDHVVSLVPEDTIETVSVDELTKDGTLGADTPITIVREVEQTETAVAEQLIAESGGDLDTKLHVLVRYDDTVVTAEEQNVATHDQDGPEGAGQTAVEQDTMEQTTVREVLDRIRTNPETPITLVKKVRFFEVTTLRELLEIGVDPDAFLNVIRQPYRLEAATLADLLQRTKAENPDTIFYLHTVQATDKQGIWGIVHFGLIDNFARGMAVQRGEDVETYTVQIPRHADERLEDQSSSFLGKLIDEKTKDSFVYNFRDDRMGRNPDRIYPGQEIVIINFQPEELIAIYKHFATG